RRAVAPGGRRRGSTVSGLRGGGAMTLAFPSREWVSAYGTEINASESYRAASREWTDGAVALVVNAQPEIGITEPVAIWLDLERGMCREAKVVSRTAPEQP